MSSRYRPAAPYPRSVFVDTSAFYALADTTEGNHPAALPIARGLAESRTRLVLSNFIRAEAHALILNRLGRHAADRFLSELGSAAHNTLVRVSEADEQAALALIARYQDRRFSITDATSFILMERLHITHAFTFDRNFVQYGLLTLPSLSL
jgi:predicted nucleic acid-binding protein